MPAFECNALIGYSGVTHFRGRIRLDFRDIAIVAANETSEAATAEGQPAGGSRVGNSVRRILKWALVTYGLVAILLGFFQRSLLYHPRKASSLPVAAHRDVMATFPESKDLRLTCDNGTEIGAWLLRKSDQANDRPLILYFHGNAQDRSTRGPWYELFEQAGADVLAIDYPGYGDSAGKMTEGGMYQSCEAAWNYATAKLNYPADRIIIAGTSLGGAAAVYTAWTQRDAEEQPAALFVTSSFSSMVDVAGSLYWWLPVSAILIDRYPSDTRIGDIKCPVTILHGTEDELVFPEHGRKLFEAAPEKSQDGIAKRWVDLEAIGHNGLVRMAADVIQPEIDHIVQRITR